MCSIELYLVWFVVLNPNTKPVFYLINRDFAYVARDQATSKHRCHVFRCHGNISGRAIHNKLHEMCNKILAEKKKARENQNGSTRHWSDIMNTPPKPSAKGTNI